MKQIFLINSARPISVFERQSEIGKVDVVHCIGIAQPGISIVMKWYDDSRVFIISTSGLVGEVFIACSESPVIAQWPVD